MGFVMEKPQCCGKTACLVYIVELGHRVIAYSWARRQDFYIHRNKEARLIVYSCIRETHLANLSRSGLCRGPEEVLSSLRPASERRLCHFLMSLRLGSITELAHVNNAYSLRASSAPHNSTKQIHYFCEKKKDWERDVIRVLGKVRLGKREQIWSRYIVYMYGISKQMKITWKVNIIKNKL